MTTISDAIFTFMVASSLSGMALNTAVQLMPGPSAADYYTLNEVVVPDAVEGEEIAMNVDRDIITDFQGRYTVTARSLSDVGWNITCYMTSPWRHYQAESAPLDNVTLAWWTDGACHFLPVGLAEICTTITIRAAGDPLVSKCSNIFRVWENVEDRR